MTDGRDRFERARRPAEKAQRRDAILQAATDLLEREALETVSLNAIAQEAGLSKPNLYRYFESREDILLTLFLADLRSFADEVADRLTLLSPAAPEAADTVATILTDAYATRPRLCRFLGDIASVFEHNVSGVVVERVKTVSLDQATRVAVALNVALPSLSIARALWVNNMTALLVGGLWPPAHPAPIVREVLAKAEFAALRPDFRRDLSEAVLTLIRGS